MASTSGRKIILPLTNKSGGSVAAGDVVVVDTTNNDAFTTDTSGAFTGGVGIAQETIASNATGRVLTGGYAALVNVNASVTRGQYGKTHTVAKQATGSASRTAGTFCQFLTGGTTPDALVYPVDLLGSSLTNPMTTTGDIIVGASAGAPARLAIGAAGTVLKGGTTPSYGTPGEFSASAASVATSETTASTSFADLSTTGPSVTVTVGASGKVWATSYAAMANSGANDCYLGIVISGATTVAAATQLSHNGTATFRGGTRRLLSGLNAGSTTFKLQYAVSAGTGTFVVRELTIEPFI